MATITPPVSVDVYVIKGVTENIPLETIFKGIFPFLAALIIESFILIIFPQIVTILPSLMSY
jgi:TRAP-type C4-dicarboxylate transport system permease large subunit